MKKKPSYTELEEKIKLLEQENKHLKKVRPEYQYTHPDVHPGKSKNETMKTHQVKNDMQSYYDIFNSVSELIFVFESKTGKIIDTNHVVYDSLGYQHDELLRLGIDDISIFKPAAEKKKLHLMMDETARGKNQNFKWHVKRKDGSDRWLETNLKCLNVSGAKRILAVATIIPENIKSEDYLNHIVSIFDNIHSGIYILELEDPGDDSSLKVIMANPATEKLTGIPVKEITGKTVDENFPGAGSKGVQQILAKVVRNKETCEIDRFDYSDARVEAGTYSIKAFPLPENRIGVTIENFTEKKKAEEELLSSTRYMKAIMDASPAVLFTYDFQKQNINYISDKVFDLTGYTPEEIIDMHYIHNGLVYADDLLMLEDHAKNSRQSELKEIPELEFRVNKKDGSAIWVSIAAIIYERDNNQAPLQLIGTILEITKRKEAELALKKSEENYRLIVEEQSDLIIKYNTEGVILFVSPSYCEKFGMTEEELTDTKHQPLIHESDRLKTSALREDLKNPPYISYFEQREMTKDGWRWLSWTEKALLDEDGSIKEIIGVGRDITDRKITENSLMESEELYRTLFEQAADGILVENSEGYIIDLNKNLSKITGYTKEDLLGKKTDILFDESELVSKPVRYDKLRSGAGTITEHKIIRKDAITIDVEMKAKQLSDGRLQAFFRDITEKKKSDKALIESEQKYRLLFETATDAIFMVKNDIFTDCNSATLKIYGCKREQIIGRTPYKFSPKTQPDGKNSKTAALKKIHDALNIGPQQFEWQHIRYDGTPFDAEVTLKKIELSGSVYLQAFVRDITDRKAAENALKEREFELAEANQMLELILNTIPVRVFWKDKNFEYLGCNKLFAADAGYEDPKSLIGKNDYDLNWKDQAHLYRADDTKVLSTSSPILNIEEPQTTPDGDMIWLKTNKIQLRNMQGETIGILGTYEDITERKQIENKILDAIIMTEEKEREKFAKNLHDDLGPLLSSIKMYVNSILNTNSVEKQTFIVEQLNEITKEAIQSTKEISNDLSPHILKNYGLLAAIESFSRKIEDHVQIKFESNLTDDRFSEEIETSLYRIIKELINNTIKHANASLIKVKLIKESKKINLVFKDNGIGFDPGIIESKVLTGMGLSNIISRIRSLKGNYTLTSETNKGIEFKLFIPFTEQQLII